MEEEELSQKELRLLLERLKENLDIEERKDIEERICKAHYPFVSNFAEKFHSVYNDFDDCVQVGFIGLLNAIRNYNSNENIEFISYAWICIRNELIKLAKRNELTRRKEYSFSEKIGTDKDGNKILLEDILLSKDSIDEANDRLLAEYLKKIMGKVLSPKQKEVTNLFYGFKDGVPYESKEIAQELKVSLSNVYVLNRTAVRRIQKKHTRLTMIDDQIFYDK